MKQTLTIACALFLATICYAQSDSIPPNAKTGWTFGILPSIGYDADKGFQIGALTKLYYFGDGSSYPQYMQSIYAQASYSTSGSGLFRLSYDSEYLIPEHRLSIDVTYLPESVSNFYGFNGFQSIFNSDFINKESNQYITRTYYRMKRNLFRLSADIQGNITGNLYWNGGIGMLYYDMGAVNIDRLNKFIKNEDKKLPDTNTLYDNYVKWGLISEAEKDGGIHPYIHGGLTYDSRDRQQNPLKGIHTDAFLTYNAAFGDMKEYNNLKLNLNWRHYVPMFQSKIVLAYQVGAQLTLAGKSPFYLNTYLNQFYFERVIYEGLGGSGSIRGVMRNRILANGIGFANVELRIKITEFKTKKNNIYIGINPFMDGGMVLQPYDMDGVKDIVEANQDIDLDESIYEPHLGVGCGLKLMMNENFVISLDWATAIKQQDNEKFGNFYMNLGYMF